MMKAILFDADGVIINSEMFSLQYQKEFDVSNNEMLPFFNNEFQECIKGKLDLKEIIKPWLEKWKWDKSVDEFLLFWFKSEHKIDNRIIELIRKLKEKNIKCYLATNQEKYRTEYMRNDMKFKEYFDDIFSSAEIGHKKPDKEFFDFILNQLKNKYNINSDKILFVDDSRENIEAAEHLGIETLLYKKFEELKEIVTKVIN
jgi:putative hydrolase of the HAD superfamily